MKPTLGLLRTIRRIESDRKAGLTHREIATSLLTGATVLMSANVAERAVHAGILSRTIEVREPTPIIPVRHDIMLYDVTDYGRTYFATWKYLLD